MTVFIISQMIFFVSSFGCGEKIQMQSPQRNPIKIPQATTGIFKTQKKTLKIKQPVGFHDV